MIFDTHKVEIGRSLACRIGAFPLAKKPRRFSALAKHGQNVVK